MSGPPIDRGWALWVLVGFFITSFIMVGTAKSYGILMGELMKHFKIPAATGALVMGVSGGVYTITAPICVACGEVFSQRKVVIVGSLIGFVMVGLSSLLVSIEYFVFFYGVGTGLANACFFGNGLVMVGMYFKKWRSLATGLALSGASVGTFVIPILLEALLETFSLSGAILVISSIYFNGCISAALYRPFSFYTKSAEIKSSPDSKNELLLQEEQIVKEEPIEHSETEKFQTESEKNTEDSHIESEEEVKKSLLELNKTEDNTASINVKPAPAPNGRPVWRFELCGRTWTLPVIIQFNVLTMPVVLFFTVFSFFVFIGYFNFILFLPVDALSRGITKYEKAVLVSCTGVGDLVGRILVGFLGDLKLIQRYKILAISCILCGANIILFEIAGQVYWWMAIHATLYGFFGGCYVAINSIVLIDMVGLKLMPKALGVILLIQGLGAAMGQPIEGKIFDETRTYTSLNIINTVLMVGAGMFLFLYPLVKPFQDKPARKEENLQVQVEEEA